MHKKFLSERAFFVILGIVLTLMLIYVSYDNTPPHWDAGRHFYNSLQYWIHFKNIFLTQKLNGQTDAARDFFVIYNYYPPGAYWLTMPFLAIFGRTYQSALLGNIVWLTLLAFSVKGWLDESNIFKTPRNIALAFLLGLPIIIGQSRELQLDFPEISCIFFVLFSAEKLLNKLNTQNVIQFSLALALAIFVKWSAIIYLPLIILFYSIRQIQKFWEEKNLHTSFEKAFKIIYITITSIGAINFVWYITNLGKLRYDLTLNSSIVGIAEGDPQGITLESFNYYIAILINTYFWLGWVLFFLILIAISAMNLKKIKFKEISASIYWNLAYSVISFIAMYLYHMKQGNKDPRYIIILLPSFVFFVAFLSHLIYYFEFKNVYKRIIYFTGLALFIINVGNLYLPIESKSIILNQKSKFPITLVGDSGYTNPRMGNHDWAIYKALSKAQLEKNSISNLSCLNNSYWDPKPNIAVDFDPMPLHSNLGTVWGLSEKYGMHFSNLVDSCLLIIARNQPLNEIDITKYKNEFQEVERFNDWQGFNMVLLKRRI